MNSRVADVCLDAVAPPPPPPPPPPSSSSELLSPLHVSLCTTPFPSERGLALIVTNDVRWVRSVDSCFSRFKSERDDASRVFNAVNVDSCPLVRFSRRSLGSEPAAFSSGKSFPAIPEFIITGDSLFLLMPARIAARAVNYVLARAQEVCTVGRAGYNAHLAAVSAPCVPRSMRDAA